MTTKTMEEAARAWLAADPDPETRAELTALLEAGDPSALAERFESTLAFGTAGIRGVLGAGPARMNRLLVRRVSAAVAEVVARRVEDALERGIVVGYDGRKNSRVFAEDTAAVFLAAGFRVRLATSVLPTPATAFALLHHHAAAAVMVTASHNPPEYNGYKVYAENGAQIVPPMDREIAGALEARGDAEVPLANLEDARAEGRLLDLGDETLQAYLEGVLALRRPDAEAHPNLEIAYTPLHGVGAELAEAALARAGYASVHTVAAQREPDPAFPTVRFPNPEEAGAMDAVLALATEVGADLAIANDPDADRLAVALPAGDGWRMLTGDQVGVLLADYLLDGPAGEAPRAVSCSLVSSQLLEKMATARGVAFLETLTGFKWIANAAMRHSAETGARFVMGYEEALGYTVGELVRDKDGISAALVFCDLVSHLKRRGERIWDALTRIYQAHGLHLTAQKSLVLPGREGRARIDGLMARFRERPPERIGPWAVLDTIDLIEGHGALPPGNVLIHKLEGGRRVILRPSGTEPKLKSYYEVVTPLAEGEAFEAAEPRAREALDALIAAHQEMLA
jgi:phosphomannomutase